MALVFHPLVQRDLGAVIKYYEREGGAKLADRFFAELENLVARIEREPASYHLIEGELRRANFQNFPYHFLFRLNNREVRILVLRHHSRALELGLKRR